MAEKKSQSTEDLLTVYKTLFLDLPLAGTRWGLGMSKEKEVTETAWKGYDAWARLASASIDNLYRNPLVGDLLARSLEGILRWQRLSNALAGAFFAGLWQAVGLPKSAEVQALQAEVQALREELRSLTAVPPAQSKEREVFIKPEARTEALQGGDTDTLCLLIQRLLAEANARMETLQVKMKGDGAVAVTSAAA